MGFASVRRSCRRRCASRSRLTARVATRARRERRSSLVDGICAGIWRRKKTAKRIELTVEPARRLTRLERAGVDAEAERIGAFLGLEPRLTI